MTSPKRVATNRINGRKSRGPRTAEGKARASRNAYRHGLAVFSSASDPTMAERVQEMVDAICGEDRGVILREQAGGIAETQLWLSCVRAQKVQIIERLRDPNTHPIQPDDKLSRAREKRRRQIIAPVQKRANAANRQRKCEAPPRALKAPWAARPVMGTPDSAQRDEYEALREGIRDLMRLVRYERRARSGRQKAVRSFMTRKLENGDGGA